MDVYAGGGDRARARPKPPVPSWSSPVARRHGLAKRWAGLGLAAWALAGCGSQNVTSGSLPVASPGAVQLTSPDFVTGATMPLISGCNHGNRLPTIEWTGGPPAEEFAITMLDRDAPGGGFVHWVIWGIPPGVRGIAAGRFPPGVVEGRNDAGDVGYTGPCPPAGERAHRYAFTIYSLSKPPALRRGARLEDFLQAVNGTVGATGTLIGTFGR